MKPEDTLDFHIRWTWAKILRLYNIEASKSGGTMSIGYILLNIDKNGTPSTQLGPKMGMEPRSLTRSLKSMEDKGLIFKKHDEKDKRKVLILLTEEGKKHRRTSKKVVLEFNSFIRENISAEKLSVFFEVMTNINELIENNHIFDEKSN